MKCMSNGWNVSVILGCLLALPITHLSGEESPQTDEAVVLNSARRAYNEKDFRFATERFREFLTRFASSAESIHAKLGLGMSILDAEKSTEEDAQTAVTQLAAVVAKQDFPQRPIALYYLGAGYRQLGRLSLSNASAEPAKATAYLTTAVKHFETAATHLATASAALRNGLAAPEQGKPLSEEWEWVARALCDEIESRLRAGKPQESLAAAEVLLADTSLERSRRRHLALYYKGFAAFRLSEAPGISEADRANALNACIDSLTKMAAVGAASEQEHAGQAMYLLARAQHLVGKREEAFKGYDGVIAQHLKMQQQAVEALKNPETFKDKPDEKKRMEVLSKANPEHIIRSQFYRAAVLFEQGTFDKALEAFSSYITAHPDSPLTADASLRQGICLWQLKKYPECIEALTKLSGASPRLADQALLWIGKSHVSIGDPSKPPEYLKSLETAAGHFGKAIELLKGPSATDAAAKGRLIEALLHVADTQMLARKYGEAAANYQQMQSLGLPPERSEELLYRQATALQLAEKYPESEVLCTKFKATFPQSKLLGQVLFRSAENAFFQATALDKMLTKETVDREGQIKKAFVEAAARYQAVLDGAPEIPEIKLAILGLGASLYRSGDYAAANAALAGIPGEEMKEKLAHAALLRSDCLLRLVPEVVPDEAALARLNTDMDEAIKLLNTFVVNNPKSSDVPDALLKLGLCHQKKAESQKVIEERNKASNLAAASYDKFIQQFSGHDLLAQVVIEKARSLVTGGEAEKALVELHKFTAAPLNTSPYAPLALLRKAIALRAVGKAQEALTLLEQVRKQYEEGLVKADPEKQRWAILLHFQHGVALKDVNKLPEAKALMQDFLKRYPDRPEIPEALLWIGQAMVAEGKAQLDAAQAILTKPNASQQELATVRTSRQDAFRTIESAGDYYKQVLLTTDKHPTSPAWPRVHYELAWCYRMKVQDHFESSRRAAAAEAAKPKNRKAAKADDPEKAKIAYHPMEAPMAKNYKAIIEKWPESPIALDAQFELAEYLVQRAQYDFAIGHLQGALAKPGRDELKPNLHFLLGLCFDEKGQTDEALKEYESFAADPEHPLAPYAAFRSGVALLRTNAPAKAAPKFRLFVDQPTFQKVAGLSDRALLHLAIAERQSGNFPAAQKACETLLARFPTSSLMTHVQYELGQALQGQKQFDTAISAFTKTVIGTTDETAAKAQFQIGECRLEQKRYRTAAFDFMKVVHSYEYPEWSAAALLKASECTIAEKNLKDARKYLQRLINVYPDSQHVKAANERLTFIATEEAK